LHDPAELRIGDCGAWVADSLTNVVYGHVVASDALREAYVVPLAATIRQVQEQLQAISVILPTKNDVIESRSLCAVAESEENCLQGQDFSYIWSSGGFDLGSDAIESGNSGNNVPSNVRRQAKEATVNLDDAGSPSQPKALVGARPIGLYEEKSMHLFDEQGLEDSLGHELALDWLVWNADGDQELGKVSMPDTFLRTLSDMEPRSCKIFN